MTEHQNDRVIQRLDRLERENWYWKRATLLLLIVIGAAALWSIKYAPIIIGQGVVNPNLPTDEQGFVWILYIKTIRIQAQTIEAQTIEAQRFVVKDDKGQRRAELRYEEWMNPDKGGTVTLGLYGKSTPTNAELTLSDGHVYFRINASEQLNEVASQEASEYDKKYNAAKTPEERERLGLLPLHRPQVFILADQNRSLLKLDGREGNATLQLTDRIGTSAVLGYVELTNSTGSVEQSPASSIVLLNKDHKVIWKTP